MTKEGTENRSLGPEILDMFKMANITCYCNSHPLSTATGFFILIEGRRYLISNWHVFSGRNFFTRKPLNKLCWLPDTIGFSVFDRTGPGFRHMTVPLYEDGKSRWWQCGIDKIDIAGIEVPYSPGEVEGVTVDYTARPNWEATPGSDIFITGFPSKITPPYGQAIWKRGSIASHPLSHYDERPIFLIDSATRSGMSGSPVYIVDSLLPFKGHDGTIHRSRLMYFFGVYSGRYPGSDEEFDLGIVWNLKAFDKTITNREYSEQI